MRIERTKDEIVVRLPFGMDLTELQNLVDYLRYRGNDGFESNCVGRSQVCQSC